jgi:hypothetical protein
MAKIFTKCAATGRPIDTGVEIDEASFTRLPSFVGKVFCPYCEAEHEWSKENAEVVDDQKHRGGGFGVASKTSK